MSRYGYFHCTVFLFILVLFAGSTSFAAIIPQIKNFNGTPDFGEMFTFDQFDSGLGTLDSIEIILTLNTSDGTFKADNDSSKLCSGNVKFGSQGTLYSLDVVLLNDSFINPWSDAKSYTSKSFNLGIENGDGAMFDTTEPDGYEFTVNSSLVKSDFIKSQFHSGFIGNSTFEIFLDLNQYIQICGLGGVQFSADPVTASGSVEIKYSYTIPEPSTVLLFSLCGLAFFKRRK